MVRRLYVFALLAPLIAGSCAARGPNYTRPTVTPPAAFRGATVTATQAASIADLPWFESTRRRVVRRRDRETDGAAGDRAAVIHLTNEGILRGRFQSGEAFAIYGAS
jgi:hypothetical protein